MPKVDKGARLRGIEAEFKDYEVVNGAFICIPCDKEVSMHYFNILFIVHQGAGGLISGLGGVLTTVLHLLRLLVGR